jgi:hypothetical protein
MIRVRLLDNADEALASGNINPFSPGVILQIIGVVHTRDARNCRTAVCVECYELCRPSRNYEDSAISFIECHRVVELPIFQWPICDLMCIPINQHNFRFGSYIRVDHGL